MTTCTTMELFRAPQPPYRNTAFRAVWFKGWSAGLAGRPADSCPYRDAHARAFARAWTGGWQAAHELREAGYLLPTGQRERKTG